jgi:hypothetical protein
MHWAAVTPGATHSLPVRVGTRWWPPFSVVGLVLVLQLREVPLRTTTGGDTATEPVDVPFEESGHGTSQRQG